MDPVTYKKPTSCFRFAGATCRGFSKNRCPCPCTFTPYLHIHTCISTGEEAERTEKIPNRDVSWPGDSRCPPYFRCVSNFTSLSSLTLSFDSSPVQSGVQGKDAAHSRGASAPSASGVCEYKAAHFHHPSLSSSALVCYSLYIFEWAAMFCHRSSVHQHAPLLAPSGHLVHHPFAPTKHSCCRGSPPPGAMND